MNRFKRVPVKTKRVVFVDKSLIRSQQKFGREIF